VTRFVHVSGIGAELPQILKSPRPKRRLSIPGNSAIRTIGGSIIYDTRSPKALAEALGFLHLPRDDVAVNLSAGIMILRIAPKENASSGEDRVRTNLLWRISEDAFQCVELLSDVMMIATAEYGGRPGYSIQPAALPARPQQRLASARREGRAPK
jgi:hypothetical protein